MSVKNMLCACLNAIQCRDNTLKWLLIKNVFYKCRRCFWEKFGKWCSMRRTTLYVAYDTICIFVINTLNVGTYAKHVCKKGSKFQATSYPNWLSSLITSLILKIVIWMYLFIDYCTRWFIFIDTLQLAAENRRKLWIS